MVHRHRVTPDVDAALDSVPTRVRDAAYAASRALTQAGIRHALIGGLAVAAYGFQRSTQDVDFLIGEEGFRICGSIVTLHEAVPISVGTVAVDVLGTRCEPPLEEALATAYRTRGSDPIPVVPVKTLILLKLRAFRYQDRTDVVRLLQVGADLERVRAYLSDVEPELLPRLVQLAGEAEADNP